MYKILHFSGGVYKFDLLSEHVEDVGGLLFQENRLQISRGASFLSEEVQVIFMVPPNEVSSVKELASELKGEIQVVELDEPLKSNLINSLAIYNILCRAEDWVNHDVISESDEYIPEYGFVESGDNHNLNNLEECLDLMLSLELIEKRENEGKTEYRILIRDNI
ncbi:MAG: methyl coenzyme M reductase subunit C-related protein [Methanobacterium sp. Maddingley MBC34]|nr:MAG: methyl coenzyme M reductase subunit C-related protein [Methanobacterium sp. Maddingley MBC34]